MKATIGMPHYKKMRSGIVLDLKKAREVVLAVTALICM